MPSPSLLPWGSRNEEWGLSIPAQILIVSDFIQHNKLEIHIWDPDGSAASVIDTAPWMIIGNGHLLKGKPATAMLPIQLIWAERIEITLRGLWGPAAKCHWSPQVTTNFETRAKAVSHSCDQLLAFLSHMHSFSLFLSSCFNTHRLELLHSLHWN